jgi:hypothetical protein
MKNKQYDGQKIKDENTNNAGQNTIQKNKD